MPTSTNSTCVGVAAVALDEPVDQLRLEGAAVAAVGLPLEVARAASMPASASAISDESLCGRSVAIDTTGTPAARAGQQRLGLGDAEVGLAGADDLLDAGRRRARRSRRSMPASS